MVEERRSESQIDSNLIVKTLRDETRMEIILHLMQYKYLGFKDLVEITGRSKSTVSHHLKVLQDTQLVTEVQIEKKTHRMSKYYALTDRLHDFNVPKEITSLQDMESIIELFEYGRFYFRFISHLLDKVINYSDKAYQKAIHSVKTKTPDMDLFANMLEIINISKFVALPLSREEYSELTAGLEDYVLDFMSKIKQSKTYNGLEDQYWVTAVSIPLDLVKRDLTP